jgi:hypothetical protein
VIAFCDIRAMMEAVWTSEMSVYFEPAKSQNAIIYYYYYFYSATDEP